jgi:hypothetical protein
MTMIAARFSLAASKASADLAVEIKGAFESLGFTPSPHGLLCAD